MGQGLLKFSLNEKARITYIPDTVPLKHLWLDRVVTIISMRVQVGREPKYVIAEDGGFIRWPESWLGKTEQTKLPLVKEVMLKGMKRKLEIVK